MNFRLFATIMVAWCIDTTTSADDQRNAAFCDSLDGIIYEVRNENFLSMYPDEHWVDSSNGIGMARIRNVTQLPRVDFCHVDIRDNREVIYTCKWTTENPRSTFVSLGSNIASCLKEQGFASPPSSTVKRGPRISGARTEDRGDHFLLTLRKRKIAVYLAAFKVSTRGVGLQIIAL